MATQVNIVFTGICIFLTHPAKRRVIIGQTPARGNCFRTPTFSIPQHVPYLSYRKAQRTGGKTVRKTGNGDDDAVALSGRVVLTGNILDNDLTYPTGAPPLPNVVRIADIAPKYTPMADVLEDDITKIDPALIAARIDLPNGTIARPIPSNNYWHFFPQKGNAVRMQLAQAVVLSLTLSDNTLTVNEEAFGINSGGPHEVVTLQSNDGHSIDITIGNSSARDIVPDTPLLNSPLGPDFDFELHWNIFDKGGDSECPPVSYNEGIFTSSGFTTLGGGNCPPTQWP